MERCKGCRLWVKGAGETKHHCRLYLIKRPGLDGQPGWYPHLGRPIGPGHNAENTISGPHYGVAMPPKASCRFHFPNATPIKR